MSRSDVIFSFIRYEIKRAIARRKVLALIAFTILLDTLPYYALSTAGPSFIPTSAYPFIWIAGVFEVQPLFLNFTAILIAAGAMSEEYEQGTAELLLSKPVERNDYFAGKFLGGFILFMTILAFSILLSIASAFTFFGTQTSLDIVPGLFLVQAFSSLIFYSIAFMLGELVRRSSLAYIFSSAVFFSSIIIGAYMDLIYSLRERGSTTRSESICQPPPLILSQSSTLSHCFRRPQVQSSSLSVPGQPPSQPSISR